MTHALTAWESSRCSSESKRCAQKSILEGRNPRLTDAASAWPVTISEPQELFALSSRPIGPAQLIIVQGGTSVPLSSTG